MIVTALTMHHLLAAGRWELRPPDSVLVAAGVSTFVVLAMDGRVASSKANAVRLALLLTLKVLAGLTDVQLSGFPSFKWIGCHAVPTLSAVLVALDVLQIIGETVVPALVKFLKSARALMQDFAKVKRVSNLYFPIIIYLFSLCTPYDRNTEDFVDYLLESSYNVLMWGSAVSFLLDVLIGNFRHSSLHFVELGYVSSLLFNPFPTNDDATMLLKGLVIFFEAWLCHVEFNSPWNVMDKYDAYDATRNMQSCFHAPPPPPIKVYKRRSTEMVSPICLEGLFQETWMRAKSVRLPSEAAIVLTIPTVVAPAVDHEDNEEKASSTETPANIASEDALVNETSLSCVVPIDFSGNGQCHFLAPTTTDLNDNVPDLIQDPSTMAPDHTGRAPQDAPRSAQNLSGFQPRSDLTLALQDKGNPDEQVSTMVEAGVSKGVLAPAFLNGLIDTPPDHYDFHCTDVEEQAGGAAKDKVKVKPTLFTTSSALSYRPLLPVTRQLARLVDDDAFVEAAHLLVSFRAVPTDVTERLHCTAEPPPATRLPVKKSHMNKTKAAAAGTMAGHSTKKKSSTAPKHKRATKDRKPRNCSSHFPMPDALTSSSFLVAKPDPSEINEVVAAKWLVGSHRYPITDDTQTSVLEANVATSAPETMVVTSTMAAVAKPFPRATSDVGNDVPVIDTANATTLSAVFESSMVQTALVATIKPPFEATDAPIEATDASGTTSPIGAADSSLQQHPGCPFYTTLIEVWPTFGRSLVDPQQ